MKIRKKIVLYFSATTITLTGVVLLIIYMLFSAYRKDEFQQRLNDKITFSLKFLDEVQQTSKDLLNSLDRITINDLYQEKMLLFDGNKRLIYASLDDTKILNSHNILRELSPKNNWVEIKEGDYDVIGTYVLLKGRGFYGIYKAYDTFGYTQMLFLAYVLWAAFAFITVITLVVTIYISRQISSPINQMAKEISHLHLDSGNALISVPKTKDEINYLAQKFNELMQRLEQSFAFQKHAIHHISHELKTPIAILVSNFEKIEKEHDSEVIKKMIAAQKEDTVALSDIINALLEISKVETGNMSPMKLYRIDELLFDVISKLQPLDPNFTFRMELGGSIENEQSLTLHCNSKLITIAFTNLLVNCIRYSDNLEAMIIVTPHQTGIGIEIRNSGRIILPSERKLLFNYFFRGVNGQGKRGFGLGLVMVYKIISLHRGNIVYKAPNESTNIFEIFLPIS